MKPISIPLTEDNEGDFVLTKEAFEESKLINKMRGDFWINIVSAPDK